MPHFCMTHSQISSDALLRPFHGFHERLEVDRFGRLDSNNQEIPVGRFVGHGASCSFKNLASDGP